MEFETASGAKVKINVADFISSMKLKKAIVEAVKESDVDIAKIDLDNLKVGAIDSILQIVLTADSSDNVQDAIFKCLERCTYNSEKITKDIFEPVEAREDYYEIVIACLKENLTPFFKPLFLKLNDLQEKIMPKSPEQK
jgi:hypothetical protein